MDVREALRSNAAVYKAHGLLKYGLFRTSLLVNEWKHSRSGYGLDGLPLPPPKLRYRVGGSFDRDVFQEIGKSCAQTIRALAQRAGVDLDRSVEVLDFACGCGRVIRHFRDHPAQANWTGSDIDAEALQWCRENLGGIAAFSQNGFQPPTSFDSDRFDVIYSVSLFTHLDEEDQFRWLTEMARILRPGGILIATAHGSFTHQQLPAVEAGKTNLEGFLYRTGQTGKLKLDGLPDYYQTAYHTEEYIRDRWSKYLEIVDYERRAFGGYQDGIVLRKGLARDSVE